MSRTMDLAGARRLERVALNLEGIIAALEGLRESYTELDALIASLPNELRQVHIDVAAAAKWARESAIDAGTAR